MEKYNNVEDYIKSFPKDTQNTLEQIRKIIKEMAPDATESIAYGMPAYKINDHPLAYFAAFKNHIGFYPLPDSIEFVKDELAKYKHAKGSIQFLLTEPIPFELIKKMVKFRRRHMLTKNEIDNVGRPAIEQKYGNPNFKVNSATYIMGVNYKLANQIAERFKQFDTVLDVCTGSGFMAIALTKSARKVITIDINIDHLKMARKNAEISKVEKKMQFIHGDILDENNLSKFKKIDAAFLDPDWSKADDDKHIHVAHFSDMIPDGIKLLKTILTLTPNIAFKIPRDITDSEFAKLPPHELEKIYMDGDWKFYVAYFGSLAKKK